ncbi:MAG: L,D-transpeptidase [Vicinamibacterales bacterium]
MAKGVQQAMKCQTILLSSLLLMTFADTALAQGWPPWADDAFHDRRSSRPQPNYYQDTPEPLRRPYADAVQDGGPRPAITPRTPAVVEFTATFPANSIVIDTGKRKLYYVLEGNRAYEYRISVGREGFNWSGTETVSRKQAWPDWHPPAEMRERDPKLPEKMTGGARNPLGAMALYLGNTLYRIHGTNDVKSIGQAQSSGCFRMLNTEVLHLASVTGVGTPVSVVTSLVAAPEVTQRPEPPRPAPERVPEGPSVAQRLDTTVPGHGARDYQTLRQEMLRRP